MSEITQTDWILTLMLAGPEEQTKGPEEVVKECHQVVIMHGCACICTYKMLSLLVLLMKNKAS